MLTIVLTVVNIAQSRLPCALLASALAVGLVRAEAGVAAQEGYLPRLSLDGLRKPLEAAGFACAPIKQSHRQPLVWLCTRNTASVQEYVQIWGRDRTQISFVDAAMMPLSGAASTGSLFRLIASLPLRGEQAKRARARARAQARARGAAFASAGCSSRSRTEAASSI